MSGLRLCICLFFFFFLSEYSYAVVKRALNLDSKLSSSHDLLPTVCQSPPVPHPHTLTQIEPRDVSPAAQSVGY